jgi:hypothetical protein
MRLPCVFVAHRMRQKPQQTQAPPRHMMHLLTCVHVHVRVFCCRLEDKGALALAAALKGMPRGLALLRLDECAISARSGVVLGKVLAATTTLAGSLRTLSLRGNPLGPVRNMRGRAKATSTNPHPTN